MRAQRFSDALLRSGTSPLLSFLAPSVSPSTWTPIYRKCPSQSKWIRQPTTLRCLATKTSPLNASAATASKVDEYEDEAHPTSGPQTEKAPAKDIGNILKTIYDTNAGAPRRPSPQRPGSIPYRDVTRDGRTSADLASESRYRSYRQITDRQGFVDREAFANEFNEVDTATLLDTASRRVTKARTLLPPVRLDAFVGRSEDVDPLKGVDLGRAIRKLEIKCAYNNVRQDFNKQRFHERPGLKRKRLKSQRWEKRFREGFKAVVSKVQKMRMKGW
jgi:ribosomal protein S21